MPAIIFGGEESEEQLQSKQLPISAMKSEFVAPPASNYVDALRNPLVSNTPHTRRSANDHRLWDLAKAEVEKEYQQRLEKNNFQSDANDPQSLNALRQSRDPLELTEEEKAILADPELVKKYSIPITLWESSLKHHLVEDPNEREQLYKKNVDFSTPSGLSLNKQYQ